MPKIESYGLSLLTPQPQAPSPTADTILAVDDDTSTRDTLRELLQLRRFPAPLGIEVDRTRGANEVLTLARAC